MASENDIKANTWKSLFQALNLFQDDGKIKETMMTIQ